MYFISLFVFYTFYVFFTIHSSLYILRLEEQDLPEVKKSLYNNSFLFIQAPGVDLILHVFYNLETIISYLGKGYGKIL